MTAPANSDHAREALIHIIALELDRPRRAAYVETRASLRKKLDAMLHDETGDPRR